MSVRLTSQEGRVALFDSTTGFAFGPTFDSQEDAEEFCAFVAEFTRGEDLRQISQSRLEVYYRRWLETQEKTSPYVAYILAERHREREENE